MKKYLLLIPILLLTSCHNNSLPYRLEDKYYTKENKGLVELENLNSFFELE